MLYEVITGSSFGQNLEIHVLAQGDFLRVDTQDLLPALDIGFGNHDLPVEPARPKKGWVKHVRSYNFV